MPPTDDPGHILPAEEWARVQRDAEAIAAAQQLKTERGRDNRLRGIAAPMLTRSAFPSVTGFVQCKYDGGARPGAPTFGVLHDAETPLKAGYAQSIAQMFTRNTNETSAHFMVDPIATVQLLDTARVAWHVGNGNPRSIGVEQAGYAAFTAADWTTAPGLEQMGRVAALMRDLHAAHGIGLYWMTDAQLRDAHAGKAVGGWATHDQCHRVLGGTTHTDPMPHYPLDQLMALAIGPKPAPAPAPLTPSEEDPMSMTLPAGDQDFVIAVRPSDKTLKLVAFQGDPVKVNQINAMKTNAKGDVDGVALAGAFDLPRFHGPTWAIPDGCTCVVVNYHADQPISAVVY